MADTSQLQRQINDIKSEIEKLNLQMQNSAEENNEEIQKKINELKDRQVQLTEQIEKATGLSEVLGDVQKG